MVNEGYAKYKDSLSCLWTTNMDRVMIPAKYMDKFNKVPRSHLGLTATLRYSGNYTGMDIADEGVLAYDAVWHNQSTMKICMHSKERSMQQKKSMVYILFPCTLPSRTRRASIARMFVGPDLCRDPEWLSTTSGYTVDVGAVTGDLQGHDKFLHSIIVPQFESYKQLHRRFDKICKILIPVFEQRRNMDSKAHADMIQWLINTAKGPDTDSIRLVRRIPFLNMAAIHTTTHFGSVPSTRVYPATAEEITETTRAHGGVKASTLANLKKLDSSMASGADGFEPVTLSNNITILRKTFISMPIYPTCRDPKRYPDPENFDGYRFYKLHQVKEEA